MSLSETTLSVEPKTIPVVTVKVDAAGDQVGTLRKVLAELEGFKVWYAATDSHYPGY